MGIEALIVVAACLNGVGCQETSTQYYESTPELKRFIEKHEKKAEEVAGPVFVSIIAPAIYAYIGGTGNVRLTELFSLQVGPKTNILVLRKDF